MFRLQFNSEIARWHLDLFAINEIQHRVAHAAVLCVPTVRHHDLNIVPGRYVADRGYQNEKYGHRPGRRGRFRDGRGLITTGKPGH
jgi:hypothetical protein